MQSAAPEAIDLAQESKLVHELYGTEDPACRVFARQCLTARRLLERGVRFIQIFAGRGVAGDGSVDDVPWDAHSKKNDRGHGCRDSGSVGILETHKMHLCTRSGVPPPRVLRATATAESSHDPRRHQTLASSRRELRRAGVNLVAGRALPLHMLLFAWPEYGGT